MKTISVSRLIATFLFLAMLPIPGYALTHSQIFDKVKGAVVVVKALDIKGQIQKQGSGVLIASGRVVTNYLSFRKIILNKLT